MAKATLIIMAGGLGSRFGGLKQLAKIGKHGEKIIDYSIFDAKRAGFDRVVFVIKEENLEIFKSEIGDSVAKHIQVDYVFQSTDRLPEGYAGIEGREKPLGTGHAVWCCKDVVNEPFAVINADDYYGPNAFKLVYDFLGEKRGGVNYCMAGFVLGNTLTDNGTVSRGVCEIDKDNRLMSVCEHKKLSRNGNAAQNKNDDGSIKTLPLDSVGSMNFWGFTKSMMEEMEKGTAESQKNIVDYVANTYKENGKSLQLSTQEQIDMLKRYVAEHKNSEDAAVKKQVEASEMQLKTLEKQLKDELGVVTDAIPEHATLWETMCTAGLNAYKKNENQFFSAAFEQTEKAKKGIDDGTPQTEAAWQALADEGYAVLDGNTWKYTDAGENYALGLKNGVNNRAGEVFGAVSNMGLMMISALHDSLKENSPSKAAFEAGDFFTIGTINGVENEKKKLFSTITDMGKGMVERLQDNSAIMQRAQSEMFGVDGTFLSNTKAILESEQVNQINVYLDSRMIEQTVVKRVNRNQTFKSIVTGG